MPGNDYEVLIAADVSEFTSGMESAATAAKDAGESIQGAFSGIDTSALKGVVMDLNEASQVFKDIDFDPSKIDQSLGVMKELETQTGKSVSVFKEMKSAFWDVWTASFAFDMIAGVIKNLTQTETELASEIQRTAAELGTSNAEAHAWIDSAELSGVAANSFTTASRTMNSQVAAGGKQLKEMGISLRDNDGAMKTTGQLIEETIAKLESYSASADRNALAQKTLGRGWIDLVANGQSLIENLKQQEQEFAGAGTAEDQLVAQGKQLQAVNAQIDQSWKSLVSSAGPALIGLLKAVEEALMAVTANARAAMAAIEGVFRVASGLGGVAKGISEMTPGGGDLTTDQGALVKGFNDITDAAKGVGDTITDTGKKIDDVFKNLDKQRGQLWVDHLKMIKMDLADAGMAGEGGGVKGAGLTAAPPAFEPKGGGKKKGGGGGADPMAGLDEQMDLSKQKMEDLNKEYQKLGSESAMAAKEGGQSFQQLSQAAQQQFQVMQTDYKKFTDAVTAGDKEAAKKFEADWKSATQEFQKDFDQAKQKAQQDMQQIKSTADQISSEISGILNNAISGKINWAQEFTKILEKILDSLIKHLTQMIAMWASHFAQQTALQATSGAQGLAIQKAQNTVAGTSDAVTAAKGAYASAAQIPYIGWLVAPIAAAAAFAGVEAFGSAEGGAVIAPGQNPIMQLHSNEMVIPSSISKGLQQAIAGGGFGGGPGNINVTSNVNALDPRSISDIIDGANASIAKAAAKYHRGGGRFNVG